MLYIRIVLKLIIPTPYQILISGRNRMNKVKLFLNNIAKLDQTYFHCTRISYFQKGNIAWRNFLNIFDVEDEHLKISTQIVFPYYVEMLIVRNNSNIDMQLL